VNGYPLLAPNDPPPDDPLRIRRLTAADAPLITDCFQRVYGNSYANELFYDPHLLATHIEQQRLFAVGACMDEQIVGHMAMTIPHPQCTSAELGNTVVDPSARGGGIAWRVGDELIQWCKERGYSGFLHYPTTDHHIMQRQAVKAGFETGLMLGYIPAETDGQVHTDHTALRQAATVVYQPLAPAPAADLYCPADYVQLLTGLAAPTGLSRRWRAAAAEAYEVPATAAQPALKQFGKRKLQRLHLPRFNTAASETCQEFLYNDNLSSYPCQQLDLCMKDPNIGYVTGLAITAGFEFCAWLPGFAETDVLRLQRIDNSVTDLQPEVVNPVAQQILARRTSTASS